MAESWPSHLQSNAVWAAQRGAQTPLFSADVLQNLQSMLNPYFNAQRNQYNESFQNQFNSQMGQAGGNAAALASYRGLNPATYIGSAQSKVRQDMMPGYFQGMSSLTTEQIQMLLQSMMKNQAFSREGQMGLSNAYLGTAGADVNSRQIAAMDPNGWDYFMGILGGAANTAGGAAGVALAGG